MKSAYVSGNGGTSSLSMEEVVNLEVETKLALTRDDYERLVSACTVKRVVDQLNVYYDVGGVLADKAITLRVRYCGGRTPVITMKLPHAYNGEAREMLEIEEPCEGDRLGRSISVRSDLSHRFWAPLQELGIDALCRVGWLRTLRLIVDLPGGAEVELDKVALPDGSLYYEAEIESPDLATHVRVAKTLRALATHSQLSTLSKFERFTEAVRRHEAARSRIARRHLRTESK